MTARPAGSQGIVGPGPSPQLEQAASARPTYIIECHYCGKQFSRIRLSTTLNAHKDLAGFPCPGRAGYVADTR